MIVEASVSGVFKTFLMILGAFVLLRFFGQLMVAKRNLAEQNQLKAEQNKFEKELKRKRETFGKTSIISKKYSKSSNANSSIEDVDFEEIS